MKKIIRKDVYIMEMTYGGAMVLPRNYVVMDEEEMTYLEGGADKVGLAWELTNLLVSFGKGFCDGFKAASKKK